MNANIFENIVNKVLQEYSADQRLPFDDDYFKNKNYLEQYTDWLEDFGKYGTLPPSKLEFWDEVNKAIKYIFESKIYEKYDLELNIYGENELLEKLVEIIHNNLSFDENGNLYVERQVRIEGSAKHYNKSTFDNYDPKILYNNLVDNYNNNVGGCWSYNKGGSKAYCSKEEGDIITLNGELIGNGNLWFTYINPFNDEYDSTVVCNMYGGIPKFSLITKNGVLVKGGNLWLDVISLSFEDGLALSMVNNKKYYIDTKGNFYDYETKQPIPSPIDNNKNESKKKH